MTIRGSNCVVSMLLCMYVIFMLSLSSNVPDNHRYPFNGIFYILWALHHTRGHDVQVYYVIDGEGSLN